MTHFLTLPALRSTERQLIVDALVAARGNQRAAARALGISRWSLVRRMKWYEIDGHRYVGCTPNGDPIPGLDL